MKSVSSVCAAVGALDAASRPRYRGDMDALRRMGRDRAAVLAGLLAPVAVSAILVPWRTTTPNTDAALILVAVIVAVAANGHRAAGVLAAVSAALWFDFFLVEPYERFTITRHTDLETTLLLLAVGVAVTEIAVRGRRHHAREATEAAYVEALHTTAELVAEGRPGPVLVKHVTGYLKAVLNLEDCRYEDGTFLGHPPRLLPDGRISRNGARWDIEQYGLPDQPVELHVRAGGHVFGRFLLVAKPGGAAPSLDARLVAVTLANQLGVGLSDRLSGYRSGTAAVR
jgi:uncharacterized protein DUF4118